MWKVRLSRSQNKHGFEGHLSGCGDLGMKSWHPMHVVAGDPRGDPVRTTTVTTKFG